MKTQARRPLLTLLAPLLLLGCYTGAAERDGDGGSTSGDPPADVTGAATTDPAPSSTTTAALPEPADSDAVDAYIRGLGHLDLVDPQAPQKIECEGDDCLIDGEQGEYTCTYTYYNTVEHFDEFVAFQPNSATLWPGSLVEGEDASHGLLTSITLPRAPLTYSVSLENLAGSPVGMMVSPSLSSFRETIQAVLASGVTGSTAARIAFELRQVFSESELSLALSTSVSWPGGNKIAGMFDFDASAAKTRIVANFTQAYYTVDVDVPPTPSALFDPKVTEGDLAAFMDEDNPPMYVQSITYGRRAVFSIETDRSEKEVRAALEAVVSALGGGGELKIETEHKELLESSTMKVFVLGGDGDDAVKAIIGYEGLVEYILAGGNYSATSPGAPLAYKLAYLDNYGTRFAYTTDFAEAECVKADAPTSTIRVFVKDIYFDGNGEGIGKGEMEYRVWSEATPEQMCEFVHQPYEKIGDGQTVTVNKHCDFVILEEPGASFSVKFSANEDGKIATGAQTYNYTPGVGWPSLGDATLNGVNKNLDVDLHYTTTRLD